MSPSSHLLESFTIIFHNQHLGFAIDCEGKAHTSENLVEMANNLLEEAEKEFPMVEVVSVVTDSAANMMKMRRSLGGTDRDLYTYACQAHLLNLVANDALSV